MSAQLSQAHLGHNMASCSATDYHTAGEPFRIVRLPWHLPGNTVADRRLAAIDDSDTQLLRRALCHEPRGHADMYGGFIVPPDDEGAHFGVLFWHKDGFSTACGHGTIALGVWAVENGIVKPNPDGVTEVVIDVPSGRVKALVLSQAGRVQAVDFVSVPSAVQALDVTVHTTRGDITCDIGYAGATYAHVDAAELGLTISIQNLNSFIQVGREIREALDGNLCTKGVQGSFGELYGTIFYEDHGKTASTLAQTNVTVFADGQVDRSPCGSGTASRVAVLHARGLLSERDLLEHRSVVGSLFLARFVHVDQANQGRDVVPIITGMARMTARHEFTFDPNDDLLPGFVLR